MNSKSKQYVDPRVVSEILGTAETVNWMKIQKSGLPILGACIYIILELKSCKLATFSFTSLNLKNILIVTNVTVISFKYETLNADPISRKQAEQR